MSDKQQAAIWKEPPEKPPVELLGRRAVAIFLLVIGMPLMFLYPFFGLLAVIGGGLILASRQKPDDNTTAAATNDEPPTAPLLPPKQRKGLAFDGLVLGILSIIIPVWGLVPAAIGMICATIALAKKTAARRMAVTGLTLCLCGVLATVAVYMPLLARARDMGKAAGCGMNLSNLGKAIAIYRAEYADQYPPNLDALLQDGSQSAKMLVCPTDPSGWHGSITESSPGSTYIYCAPRSNDDTLESPPVLIACDNAPIHPVNFNIFRSGGIWHALRSDMSVNGYTEAEFQQELQKPHNRRFAEELAKGVAMTPQERVTYIAPASPKTQPSPKESD